MQSNPSTQEIHIRKIYKSQCQIAIMNRAFQCLNCPIHYSNTWFYLIVTIVAPNPYSWNEASWWRQSGYLRFSSRPARLYAALISLPWIKTMRCSRFFLYSIVPSLHETYQLVIQYFAVAHAAGVIQQLANMQVNFDNPILATTLDDRLRFGRSICRFSVSKPPWFLCWNIHLLGRLVIPDNIIHQGRCFKENRLLECMQFIELTISMRTSTLTAGFIAARLSLNATSCTYITRSRSFTGLSNSPAEVSYSALSNHANGLSRTFLRTRIGVIHIIITVVHQICLERCSADSLTISSGTKARKTFRISPPFISGWR